MSILTASMSELLCQCLKGAMHHCSQSGPPCQRDAVIARKEEEQKEAAALHREAMKEAAARTDEQLRKKDEIISMLMAKALKE